MLGQGFRPKSFPVLMRQVGGWNGVPLTPGDVMQRRDFIAGIAGSSLAVWPLGARSQQSAMPVIGYVGSSSFERSAGGSLLNFKRGLAETGYVEERNVKIEYRWADDQYERLPALAAELVQRRV